MMDKPLNKEHELNLSNRSDVNEAHMLVYTERRHSGVRKRVNLAKSQDFNTFFELRRYMRNHIADDVPEIYAIA
jgi:hypothetical protein